MRTSLRLAAITSSVAAALALGACANPTMPTSSYPATYPSNTATSGPVYGTEFGRVTNIEYIPVGTMAPANNNIIGAVVGGLLGGVVGSNIGSGAGRTAATVLGAAGGAMVGSRIARNQAGATTAAGYRVTVQTDNGAWRTYEVGSTGDLRVGDRVRVENGVIYRG